MKCTLSGYDLLVRKMNYIMFSEENAVCTHTHARIYIFCIAYIIATPKCDNEREHFSFIWCVLCTYTYRFSFDLCKDFLFPAFSAAGV